MRFGVSIASLLFVLFGSLISLAADREMPYKAYIASDDVYVRSGPGKNYYPTTKLAAGTEVEVYRHDPGGWYAIRPPRDSFTWVAARYVNVGEDGLGTITGKQVAARVGSEFSDIRDVIQVRLHEGEVVEIVGEKQFTGTSEAGRWCQIAPPSGEFRWVFGRLVDPDYMTSGVREAPGNNSPLLIPRTTVRPENLEEPRHLSDLDTKFDGADEEDSAVIEPVVLDLSEEKIAQPAGAESTVARDASWIAADGTMTDLSNPEPSRPERVAAYKEPAKAVPATESDQAKSRGGYVSPRIPELNEPQEVEQPKPGMVDRPLLPFGEALDRIELELSLMLAEEPTVWTFTELQIQAESLLERAQTALERGKVRLLLKKIARSDDIKQRYAKFVDTEVQLDRREQRLSNLGFRSAAAGAETAAADFSSQRYDGHGRLARVVTSDTNAPRYALVSDDGRVTCYVTPAPGVNLRYYVGGRIGVHGTSGYIPSRQARHVTAKHVTALDSSLR
jgi:hypothetical protein